MEITKNTKIKDIIDKNWRILYLLKKYNMICLKCSALNNETLENCAKVHDIDIDVLIQNIKNFDN